MPEDEFEVYLTLLTKTLRLKNEQRDAIAAELRDHMQHRLEELTDQGLSRQQAIAIALNEFGDASALAHNFRTIHQTLLHRKSIMKITATAATICFAIVAGMYLFNAPAQGPAALTQTQAEEQAPATENAETAQQPSEDSKLDAASIETRKLMQKRVTLVTQELTGEVIQEEETTLEAFIAFLREQTGANMMINWEALAYQGVSSFETVSINLKDVPAEVMLDLVLQQIMPGDLAQDGEDSLVIYGYYQGVVVVTTRASLGSGSRYLPNLGDLLEKQQ